jgi:hypothetical protein
MNPMISFVALVLLLTGQHPQMPAGMSHEEHLKQMQKDEAMKKRGAAAMGFDQEATTHHFRLAATGGSIEVTVKDIADEKTIAAIRSHLRSIAGEFAAGAVRQAVSDPRGGSSGGSRNAEKPQQDRIPLRGPAAGWRRANRDEGCAGARCGPCVSSLPDHGTSHCRFTSVQTVSIACAGA